MPDSPSLLQRWVKRPVEEMKKVGYVGEELTVATFEYLTRLVVSPGFERSVLVAL